MKSVFLCILLNENYCLKAKLVETKFTYHVMHACIEFKLKIPVRKKIFPLLFWQTKLISQAQRTLSSTDRGKHPQKGFKTSLILISSITGVGVKFLPWKKQRKLSMTTNFRSLFSSQISMLNEKIFLFLISQPVKGKTVCYICYR